ncbi:MAG: tetratricopeptide repeat protein [Planctomycetota bacterium]|nr:tetratricopeptide repeat protein [Planctomycetota bacterium]
MTVASLVPLRRVRVSARDRVRACVAVLCGLFLVQGLASQEDLYAEDRVALERALVRGELSRAEALADEILADWEELEGEPDAPSDAVMRAVFRVRAEIALRRGAYADVSSGWDDLPGFAKTDPELRRLAAVALLRSGAYEEALEQLQALAAERPDDPVVLVELGLALAASGPRAAAREVFERVAKGDAATDPDALVARARAHMELGGRAHVERAASLLVEAVALDEDHPGARTLRGQLQYEVYGEWSGADSGEKLLLEVLRRNGEVEPALLWLYRIRKSNHLLDPAKTDDFLERALSANPNSVPALIERGISLVEDRRLTEGAAMFDRALSVDGRDREALAQRAAVAQLLGQAREAAALRELAEATDPGWNGVDRALGDRLVALYRFEDALVPYEAALARDGEDVAVLHGMARALTYAGDGERARELLERAASLQPGYVHPWRNNARAVQDLLGEEYERIERDGFTFLLHREDRAVLESYLVPFQLEAREVLGTKYGFEPERPVRVEVFHTWDDFSVRTIGFRGFTALGACFGPLITVVSPVDGDLRRNDFMWTATVWHEYVHVLTLGLSKGRVPRWLTEGFSVYEEGRKDRAWERGMDRELVDAWHNDAIPPVRLMNRLFRGPQILFGYYLGGRIVDLLSQDYGFPKVLDMLRAYGEDKTTEQVFEDVLGIDSRDFDRRFRDWVRDEHIARLRLRPRLDARGIERLEFAANRDPDDLDARCRLAFAMLDRGSLVDAGAWLRDVLRADPGYPDGLLAQARLLAARGRTADALEAFRRGFAAGADDFDSRMAFARALLAEGDQESAIEQLLAAKACWPTCTDQATSPEVLLARLYREQGREAEALAELASFCARTARAFEPRRQLAAHARENGDRARETELLEQMVAIDPFARSVHEDLGAAYEALGRLAEAARELEVALAILPTMDRDHMGDAPGEVPRVDSPAFREEQAVLCVRLGRILAELGREDGARRAFERALAESPDGTAASEARERLGG